jgi:hypothetical protein
LKDKAQDLVDGLNGEAQDVIDVKEFDPMLDDEPNTLEPAYVRDSKFCINVCLLF